MSCHGDPYIPARATVTGFRRENSDTATFAIEIGEDVPDQDWAPGQFNMLYAFGKGDIPISISRIESPRKVVHTVRAVGKVSRSLCALKNGEILGFRGPFGRGWPVGQSKGKDILLVAGGIGLAPLRPVIDHIRSNRQDYRKAVLIYGARSPKDMIFREEIDSWRDAMTVLVTVDHAESGWRQHVGLVTPLINRADIDFTSANAMLCGPEIMMDFGTRALVDKRMPRSNIIWSMERNMKCAIAHCGHCQFGGDFICKDGPVFSYEAIADRVRVREY